MKNFKYLFLLFGLLAFTACEDYFGENSNVDPDNPTVVTPNVILPQVQARLVYTYGGDFTRYVGLNTQTIDGISRQFAVLGQYGIQGSDVDTPWANMYSGTMQSNRRLATIAQDGGFNHYEGISVALESYAILVVTDMWGDVPYSDAFKFDEVGVYSPQFDSQESIYTAIFANLDRARALLASDDGGNAPGGDDLIYGGDASKWIQFCNVLEARARLHLSKVNGSSAYSGALAALAGGFGSSSDNAGFPFGTPATENAPWFQYIEQRDDCETGATYVGILESLNDPRTATYGQPQTNDHPIYTKDQTVNLLSFTEQEFIKAEAMLMTGDSDGAYAAYLSGIQSSMVEALVPDEYDVYVAQSNVGVGAANLTLEDVMTQKYIALNTDPEVFADWRRTNLPALTPVTGTQIPRRLPYAQTEQFSNSNTPDAASVSIFDRVWWDQ